MIRIACFLFFLIVVRKICYYLDAFCCSQKGNKKYLSYIIILTIIVGLLHLFSLCVHAKSDRSKMYWKSYKVENCYFNTRELILLESGENVKTDCSDKKNGKVISGIWKSFYSDATITDPKKIQIDHVLPYDWHYNNTNDKSTAALLKFYNDQDNLAIATVRENESKSDNLDLPFEVDFDTMIAYKLTQCRTCKKYQDSNCNVVCGGAKNEKLEN